MAKTCIGRYSRSKQRTERGMTFTQIDSVTVMIEVVEFCRKAGWGFVISHHSGDTEGTFFAVAMDRGQIKTGLVYRSKRIAKYNRLLEIERELVRRPYSGVNVDDSISITKEVTYA